MRRTVTITLMAALAALAAGCGTTVSKTTEPTQSPGTATSSPSPPSSQSQAGQVGDKFTITSGDARYDVTLVSVDQQAQPESEYASAKAGHHLAAAQFRITAITTTDENSNLSVTVTGTDEQAYNSTPTAVSAGTNFASGRILLQPGSSLVGWVPFELPNAVRIAKVHWTPTSALGARSAEWQVNSSAATSPGGKHPPDVVKAYFDAINLRDYQKAWNLGGKNTTSSYSSFVSGFKNTAMVSVQILDLSGDIGAGVVTARLTTLETDGSTKVFEGMYTVRNGVIAEFNVHRVS